MHTAYVNALEKRAQWLKWLLAEQSYKQKLESEDNLYRLNLKFADSYFMNDKFCDLVDHARISVPDDLKFELSWVPTKSGFMWLQKPFNGPDWKFDDVNKQLVYEAASFIPEGERDDAVKKASTVKLSAIGWMAIESFKEGNHATGAITSAQALLPGSIAKGYSFLTYFDLGDHFEKWSYFTISPNDTVKGKTDKFEQYAEKAGGYYQNEQLILHEIRWVFTAMHLMSQKLSMHVEHETDRATRRRAEREKTTIIPKFKVVTLRRMEMDREREAEDPSLPKKDIEWNWQWAVRGHWRNQWYPGEKVHKQVFVEAYIKGPEDRPMKPLSQKIFVAKR